MSVQLQLCRTVRLPLEVVKLARRANPRGGPHRHGWEARIIPVRQKRRSLGKRRWSQSCMTTVPFCPFPRLRQRCQVVASSVLTTVRPCSRVCSSNCDPDARRHGKSRNGATSMHSTVGHGFDRLSHPMMVQPAAATMVHSRMYPLQVLGMGAALVLEEAVGIPRIDSCRLNVTPRQSGPSACFGVWVVVVVAWPVNCAGM